MSSKNGQNNREIHVSNRKRTTGILVLQLLKDTKELDQDTPAVLRMLKNTERRVLEVEVIVGGTSIVLRSIDWGKEKAQVIVHTPYQIDSIIGEVGRVFRILPTTLYSENNGGSNTWKNLLPSEFNEGYSWKFATLQSFRDRASDYLWDLGIEPELLG